MVIPETFNDDKIVVTLFKFVFPEIFNDDIHDKIVNPDTFNDDIHDVALFKVVVPDTFNDDIHAVLLFNVVNPDTFNDDNIVDAPETNKLVRLVLFNIDVLVLCKFEMFKFE